MPEPCLKVLLIERDSEYAGHVRHQLAQAQGQAFDVQWSGGMLAGLDRLAKTDFDVILVDMDLPDCHGLDGLAALRLHAPLAPVVILSGRDDEALALRAVQIGAQDYLCKTGLEASLLQRSLQYAVVRQKSANSVNPEPPDPPARIVGCLGTKRGAGTTTLACHSGLELRRQTGQPVLLADFDTVGNSVAAVTAANSTYTVLDTANDLLRLDQTFWETLDLGGPLGLEVLPLPATVSPEAIPPERIRCVLRFLRTIYPWLVLDLGALNESSASYLSDLTDLLLVTTFDLASVRDTRHAVHQLAEMGFESRRVTLVVNQVPKIDCLAAQEVSKILGIQSSIVVPVGSIGLLDGGNVLRPQVTRLAAKLAGIEVKPVPWKYFPFLSGLYPRTRQLKTA